MSEAPGFIEPEGVIKGKDLPSIVFPEGPPILTDQPEIITPWGDKLPPVILSSVELAKLLSHETVPTLWNGDPDLARLLQRVTLNQATGCWELPAYNKSGYGRIKRMVAHRLVWEYMIGSILEGHDIDHRCRNRSCCWPRHAESKTHAENVRAAVRDRRHSSQPHFWQEPLR